MGSYLKRGIKEALRIPHLIRRIFSLYRLIKVVEPYTMVDHSRLIMLYGLAREVLVNRIEGDFVECGVCNGGSAAVLAAVIRRDPNYRLFLYDTFEGIPAPGSKDGPVAPKYTGRLKGSVETVMEALGKVGFPLERAIIRKGLFKDTFRENRTARVALLHIDADWYDSVLMALRTFYPLVSKGGIIILDDFGHWEGSREAFYDFCKEQDIKPLIEKLGPWQLFWRKEQEHNRSMGLTYATGVYWPQPLHFRRPLSLIKWIVSPVAD